MERENNREGVGEEGREIWRELCLLLACLLVNLPPVWSDRQLGGIFQAFDLTAEDGS